jgi:protein-S-isoprenylcysteine O-methyltransferase Ste14
MNAIRYAIAVTLSAAIPAALLYWLVVHPFARFWRRLGARNSYLVICPVVFAVMAGMVRLRGRLLAVDFGLSIPLALVGIVLLAGSGLLLRTLRRQLTVKVLVGVPELSEGTAGSLLTTGIYSRIRHPRYVQMTLAIVGYACIANYPAVYSAVLVWLAGIYAVILLEERELLDRFGDAYRTYCRRVPRFLPFSRERQ